MAVLELPQNRLTQVKAAQVATLTWFSGIADANHNQFGADQNESRQVSDQP